MKSREFEDIHVCAYPILSFKHKAKKNINVTFFYYRAVTKADLRKHIPTHTRKKKKIKKENTSDVDEEKSEEENKEETVNKKKKVKKYACHLCPEKAVKIFSRGTRLTTHLIKVHGAQWPCGHSRFR